MNLNNSIKFRLKWRFKYHYQIKKLLVIKKIIYIYKVVLVIINMFPNVQIDLLNSQSGQDVSYSLNFLDIA